MSEDDNTETRDEDSALSNRDLDIEKPSSDESILETGKVHQDGLEELKKQVAQSGSSIESRLAVQSAKQAKISKQSLYAVMLAVLISISSLLASLYTLYASSSTDTLSQTLDQRIESFILMESLIRELQEELELASLASTNLETQVLGFEGVLDIALEQMRLRIGEIESNLKAPVEGLGRSIAEFDDNFDAFSDSNRIISRDIRGLIQSNEQFDELEKTLSAIVTLEREKYYEIMSRRMAAEQNSTSDAETGIFDSIEGEDDPISYNRERYSN